MVFALRNCVCHHLVCAFIYTCYLTCHVNHFNEQLAKINMVEDRSSRNIASTVFDQQWETPER